MKSNGLNVCSIKNESRPQDYQELVKDWREYFESPTNKNCTLDQRCERSIFHQYIQPLNEGGTPSTTGAMLKIQFDGPNVEKIIDSYAYDFQSFIGEVGGTLGLFLGLSFLSIVEFVEICIARMFKK